MSKGAVTVLRTGKLFVFDMAVDEFKRHGVPHFTREETVTGLIEAMPAAPSGGPGTWWTIQVPAECEAEARGILDTLPFPTSTEPDVWDFAGSKGTESALRRLLLIVAILAVVYFVIRWIS